MDIQSATADISDSLTLEKLRWQCRRGMLELDILLVNFLEGMYPRFLVEDKQLFYDLLQYSDPELYQWLLIEEEDSPCQAPVVLSGLIDKIRRYACSRRL